MAIWGYATFDFVYNAGNRHCTQRYAVTASINESAALHAFLQRTPIGTNFDVYSQFDRQFVDVLHGFF